MIRATTFLHLRDAENLEARDELIATLARTSSEIEMMALQVSPTRAQAHRAGNIMAVAAFRDVDSYHAAVDAPYVASVVRPLLDAACSHVEFVRYRQGPIDIRDPDLHDGLHRTLLVGAEPWADPAAVAHFERQIARMGDYIDTIRNWSLSRVDEVIGSTGPQWTHVWEQEFTSIEGLIGEYMFHPYHYAVVDPWFDPQSPIRVLDTAIVHSMCDLEHSILGMT